MQSTLEALAGTLFTPSSTRSGSAHERPAETTPLRADGYRIDALAGGALHVVRDDLLPGGTKQRAVARYLCDLLDDGAGEFVYASPFAGFAQVALAVGAREVGARAVVFCERDATRDVRDFHAFSALAGEWGARLELCETLAQASEAAAAYANQAPARRRLLPLGFQCPRFMHRLEEAVAALWPRIVQGLGDLPSELWLPVGSGTLLRTFHRVTAGRVPLVGVDVRVLPPDDDRITSLGTLPGVTLLRAPETFHTPADLPPPLPSNAHYDAKLWRFVSAHARPGALWWNVAQ